MVVAVVIAVMTTNPVGAAAYCAPGQDPEFVLGFAFMKAQLGDVMGDPLECEHANPENGDTLQQTSTGLAFYRKSTNTPTFTDGWTHWAWTATGLVTWTGARIDPPGIYPPLSVLYTDRQVEHFKQLALYEGVRESRLTKWSEPIRIELFGDYDEDDIQSVDQTARELDQLIELPISRVNDGGNIFIVIVDADDFYSVWYELTGEFNSDVIGEAAYYTFWFNEDGPVSFAIGMADYYQSRQTRAEAIEWAIVRSMGLPGTVWDADSKFFGSFRGLLTALDKAAIQILYDPRLANGMNETEVDQAIAASG